MTMNLALDTDEIHLRILKYIGSTDGNLCYHGIAAWLGISVGKTHYCMTELIKNGHVKATRFVNSKKKMAYMYQLTPQGIEKKFNLLVMFLRQKELEYVKLKEEIADMHRELSDNSDNRGQ